MRIRLSAALVADLKKLFPDEPICRGGVTLHRALSDPADNDHIVFMFLQGKVSSCGGHSCDGQEKIEAQRLLNQFRTEYLTKCQPGFGFTWPSEEGWSY